MFNIESILKNKLVPVAQLTEVLIRNVGDADRQSLANSLWHPINLAAVFVFNPQNQAELGHVILLLDYLLAQLVKALKANGGSTRKSTGAARQKVVAELIALLPKFNQDLYRVIGFAPEEAQVWRENQTANGSLGKKGKINSWRTFARNKDLETTLRDLQIPVTALSIPFLGSNPGKQRLSELWEQTIKAAAQPIEYQSEKTNLPPGIRVAQRGDGRFTITVEFSPLLYINKNAELEKKNVTKPAALASILMGVSRTPVVCNYTRLQQELEEAVRWFNEKHKTTLEKTRPAYEAWAQDFEREALQAKLRQHFTEQELAQLKTLLKA